MPLMCDDEKISYILMFHFTQPFMCNSYMNTTFSDVGQRLAHVTKHFAKPETKRCVESEHALFL